MLAGSDYAVVESGDFLFHGFQPILVQREPCTACVEFGFGGGADPTLERMFEEMMTTMPLRSFVLFSRGKLDIKSIRTLIALMNGKIIAALRIALGGDTQW